MTETESAFATLLRRYRLEAGLTQEELAERAGLSANGLGALERGDRQRPRRETIELLVEALSLPPADRAALAAAARGGLRLAGGATTKLPVALDLGAPPDSPLIGRAEDLDRFRSILGAVHDSRGHFLLLSGEAGAGKTRLLQAIAVEANERGFAVGAVAGRNSTSRGPYAIFRRAVPALCAAVPASVRGEAEGRWKQIRARLYDGRAVEGMMPDDDLLENVTGLILMAARAAPVALLLDDIDAVDEKSVDLLHHLGRMTHGSQVLIACALRDPPVEKMHPRLASMVQALLHDRLLDLVTVRRLSYDETASFIAEAMEGAVSEEFANFAYRRTKGNPRLIEGVIRSLGGRLQLEGEIGAGAMGRVFRAHDAVTGTTVAAKLMLARAGIDLQALLRFQQEGAVLRLMDHPNIVRIHGSFVEEYVSCIIMELLQGPSLARVLGEGPLDLERAKHIGLQIADALDYAHAQSIVHRDVKPDNIMLVDGWSRADQGQHDRASHDAGRLLPDEVDQSMDAGDEIAAPRPEQPPAVGREPTVKVTDFGIARILSVDTMMGTIATTGMRVGTPLYMAPEQIQGKNIDARSDLYGYGAVLYHMVTGRPPFDGTDALEIAVKQMQEAPQAPSDVNPRVSPDWDGVILKALSKEPRRRYQSAKEMKADIERLATRPAVRPRRRSAAKSRLIAAVVATALLVGGGVAAHSATSGSSNGASLGSYLSGLAAQGNLSGTVLVAKGGKMILDQGYGMANRAAHIPNQPTTEYGLADATTTSLLTAFVLQGIPAGQYSAPVLDLSPANIKRSLSSRQLCRPVTVSFVGPTTLLGGACPKVWRGITLAQLVSGTSRLPEYRWGRPGNGIEQTERACWSMPLGQSSPRHVNYTTCGNAIMGVVGPDVNADSPWGTWLPTGLIPLRGASLSDAFASKPYDGARLGWQLFDGLHSARLALDYDSSGNHVAHEYNDYFAAYTSAPNLYRYDNRLFSGRFMPAPLTKLELSARHIPAPSDPGINAVKWAEGWKVGYLFGSLVEYTAGSLYSYQTANLRFPKAGVTVIVMANSASTDALDAAEHAAAFILPGRRALAAATLPTAATLFGTYRRQVRTADAKSIVLSYLTGGFTDGFPTLHLRPPTFPSEFQAAVTNGLPHVPPHATGITRERLILTIGRSYLKLGSAQDYSATNGGGLQLFGPPPGLQGAHFCTGQQTDLTPTGYYHWSVLGNQLFITKVSDPFCADRAQLLPGIWTRVRGS